MDSSKLPDGQRHELQQLQKSSQEHQSQQQQEQPIAAASVKQSSVYDPSQLHQSYYYNYNQKDSSQQHAQQQYDASYYQNYYSHSYQQQQQHTQPVTSAAMAPSEQQPIEKSGSGSLGLGQVQDAYVDPGNQVNVGGTLPNSGYPLPPGLNPTAAAAAVAALSQLTQFAGTMDAAIPGGARYDQGHFHPQGVTSFGAPKTGSLGKLFYGRGRGGGIGRGKARHGSKSAAKEVTAPARCELCRVDCTSKEILEQHNNGKRHKKNLQKLQDKKGEHQPVVQTENDGKPSSVTGPEVHESVPQNNPDKKTNEGDGDNNNKVETMENNNRKARHGMKRKMRGGAHGGRGAKRLRPAGLQKRKVAIPLMCDLCNVKCDTQEVFDRHAAGKKHISKLKRFEGHQAMYGPTAVQALYPPNPLSQTLGPQPAYYGATTSYAGPPEAYLPPQNPNPQLADAPLEFGPRNGEPVPHSSQVPTAEIQAGNGVQ